MGLRIGSRLGEVSQVIPALPFLQVWVSRILGSYLGLPLVVPPHKYQRCPDRQESPSGGRPRSLSPDNDAHTHLHGPLFLLWFRSLGTPITGPSEGNYLNLWGRWSAAGFSNIWIKLLRVDCGLEYASSGNEGLLNEGFVGGGVILTGESRDRRSEQGLWERGSERERVDSGKERPSHPWVPY